MRGSNAKPRPRAKPVSVQPAGNERGGFLSLRPRLQVELFSNFREENAPKYAPLLALYLLPALFAGIGILSNVIVRNIEVAEREYERLQGDV